MRPASRPKILGFLPLLQIDPPEFDQDRPPIKRPPEKEPEEFTEDPGKGPEEFTAEPEKAAEEFTAEPEKAAEEYAAEPEKAAEEFTAEPEKAAEEFTAEPEKAAEEFAAEPEKAAEEFAAEPENAPAGAPEEVLPAEPIAPRFEEAPAEIPRKAIPVEPGAPEFEEAGPAQKEEAVDVAAEEVEEVSPVSLRTESPSRNGARRENGPVNGRGARREGRVNGLTNGGLTNGRGRTNGRGAINGRGLTNGKGLVNGRRRGLVNGSGLVNGAGLVNGRRRRGLVNGSGLVNGTGFINGRGLVNGKGLINGHGLTNGSQLVTAESVPHRPKTKTRIAVAAVTIAIVLLIIIPLFYVLQVQKGVAIDGIFSDWDGVTNKYQDTSGEASVSNVNVDIDMFGVYASDTDLSFYLRVAGKMLQGAGDKGVDTLTVFIDRDHDGSGYRVNGAGGVIFADLKLEVWGYNGIVMSASYSQFKGSTANDWSGWSPLGATRAALSDRQLEAQVWMGQETGLSRSSEISVLFYMRDADGQEDYSDFTVGMNTGVLSIRQRTPSYGGSDVSLQLDVSAFGGRQVNLTSLTVSRLGGGSGGTVTLTGPGYSDSRSFGDTFSGMVMTVPSEQTISLTLHASGVSGAFGMALTSQNAATASSGARSVHVSVSGYSNTLFTLGGGTAGNIDIDGAFQDWDATRSSPGYRPRTDSSSDDIEDSATAGVPAGLIDRGGGARYQDANINLQAIAEYDPGGANLYFYAQVQGQAMGGQVVPATKRALPGYTTGGTPAKPANVGSDALYILIDDDGLQDTGFPVMSGPDIILGARYCVVISGKNGDVIDRKSFYWDAGWHTGGPGSFALASGREIEVEVSGITTNPSHRTIIIAEDWTGSADRSDGPLVGSGRGRDVTTLIVNEVDMSHHAVKVGSDNNPMFRVEMDAEGGAVEVTGIEISRDGSALDGDISGVHLTADTNGDGMPSKGDMEIAGAVRFADGKAFFAGSPIVTVNSGERITLFVAIDVSAGATLYGTFGAKVARVESGANFVELFNSRGTKEIVFAKTGGRYTSITTYICINEIHYNADGHVDWVEIINPTGSGIDISSYTVKYWGGSSYTLCYNSFTGTLSDGSTAVADNLAGYAIHAGVDIQLTNGVAAVDTVASPSASAGYSYARYRDASNHPTDVWYTYSIGSKNGANDLIPEFQEIAIPFIGIVVIFALFRTQLNARKTHQRQK